MYSVSITFKNKTMNVSNSKCDRIFFSFFFILSFYACIFFACFFHLIDSMTNFRIKICCNFRLSSLFLLLLLCQYIWDTYKFTQVCSQYIEWMNKINKWIEIYNNDHNDDDNNNNNEFQFAADQSSISITMNKPMLPIRILKANKYININKEIELNWNFLFCLVLFQIYNVIFQIYNEIQLMMSFV